MRFYQTGKSDARAVVVKVTVLAVIIKYCAISCGMILSNAVYAAHLGLIRFFVLCCLFCVL